jgi:hypothetical protein
VAASTLVAVQWMLTFQAVGIGEEHNDRRGRGKVLEWIGRDWVQDLVLELPSFADAQDVALVDNQWKNPVRLAHVIQAANAHNVNIHQWDDWFQPGVYQGSDLAVANRNQRVAADFLNHFNNAVTNAHHCVILFGANHFPGGHGFETLLPGLTWADLS